MLDAGFAIVTKVRPGHERAVAAEVIGDVRGRHVVIGDDMIVSGGTLLAAADALREGGTRDVHAFATHALLTPDAAETLAGADIAELAVTDTSHSTMHPFRPAWSSSPQPACSPRRSAPSSIRAQCPPSSRARTSSSESARGPASEGTGERSPAETTYADRGLPRCPRRGGSRCCSRRSLPPASRRWIR